MAYTELAKLTNTRTKAEVELALTRLDPDGTLRPQITVTETALEWRLSAGAGSPSLRIGLRPTPNPAGRAPIRRIALDPGHWGGAWSAAEQRHIPRPAATALREGDLSWATAGLVQRGLAAAGFDVRLLRAAPPLAEFPAGADPGFDADREAAFWLAEHRSNDLPWLPALLALDLWRQRRNLVGHDQFALHTRYDLRRRAAASDAFGADVTVSIHYNYLLSDSDGVVVFVPGAFRAAELAGGSQPFWALRRLLDGSLDRSIDVADAIADRLKRRLNLPALTPAQDPETGAAWRSVGQTAGVYARNLAILRRTRGAVVLVEGPCMNAPQEQQRLQMSEVEIDGRRYPARVRDYAEAVIEALQDVAASVAE